MSSLEGPNPFAQTWRNQLAATNPQGSVDLVWSEPVAHIVINRPEKRNAVSLAMWKAIPYLISEISTNPPASVVIVKGAGTEAFAAGADITELEACMGSDERGAAYMDAVEMRKAPLLPVASQSSLQLKAFA
jgi:enoyl-CoA hydratase